MSASDLRSKLDQAEYELWALREYHTALERQLRQLIDQTPAYELQRLSEQGRGSDEAALERLDQEVSQLVGRIYPHYFRLPFLLMLWAVFEATLTEVTDGFTTVKSADGLRRKDLKGGLLDSAAKFFYHVMQHPLDTESAGWKRAKVTYAVRNCIIHANGIVNALGQGERKELIKLSGTVPGLAIKDGYLSLSEGFIQETLDLLDGWLRGFMRGIRRDAGLS